MTDAPAIAARRRRRQRRRLRLRLMWASPRRWLTLAGLACAVLAGLSIGQAATLSWRQHHLADGATTTAVVVGQGVETLEITETHHGPGRDKHYHWLEYRYQGPHGATYTRRLNDEPGVYQQGLADGTIPIVYARRRPWISEPVVMRFPGRVPKAWFAAWTWSLAPLTLLWLSWRRAGAELGVETPD